MKHGPPRSTGQRFGRGTCLATSRRKVTRPPLTPPLEWAWYLFTNLNSLVRGLHHAVHREKPKSHLQPNK